MSAYGAMLDTNIVSDLVRHPSGRVATRIAMRGDKDLCVSIITAAELRYGAIRRASARLTHQLDRVLGRIDILPFGVPAEQEYGRLRARLERIGKPIGPNDLWIAAHALALGVTLITANLAEFRRVPGLAVENWLE